MRGQRRFAHWALHPASRLLLRAAPQSDSQRRSGRAGTQLLGPYSFVFDALLRGIYAS